MHDNNQAMYSLNMHVCKAQLKQWIAIYVRIHRLKVIFLHKLLVEFLPLKYYENVYENVNSIDMF